MPYPCTFTIGNSSSSDPFLVVAGTLTEVALDLESGNNGGGLGSCGGSGGRGGGEGGPSGGLEGLEMVLTSSPVDLAAVHGAVAVCPPGKKVTGGGFEVLVIGGPSDETTVISSRPDSPEQNGWFAMVVRTFPEPHGNDPDPQPWSLQVFAVCAIAAP